MLTHERFARTPPPDSAQLELTAIREMLHALLNADRPEEVFQFALDRISPLVGASFASVYVVDGVSELMKLAAAHNWPAKYRPWLGEMRVRLGFGPSGEAAAERRIIEVPDIRTDKGLEDWAEVARELGFRSLVALPLQHARGTLGAVTFYFAEEGVPLPERRNLMRLVAEQMAATAEKVRLVDDLRRTTAALAEASADLDTQVARGSGSVRERTRLLTGISAKLHEPLHQVIRDLGAIKPDQASEGVRQTVAEAIRILERAATQVDDVVELGAIRAGQVVVAPEGFTAADLLEGAEVVLRGAGVESPIIWLSEVGDVWLQTDKRKATRVLSTAVILAAQRAAGEAVQVEVAVDGLQLVLVASVLGADLTREEIAVFFDWISADDADTASLPGAHAGLARELARVLGGELEVASAPGQGTTVTVRLPLVYLPVALTSEP